MSFQASTKIDYNMAEGGGYNRNVKEVEIIIKIHYTRLLEQLNVTNLVDYLYEKGFVSGQLKEKIEIRTKSDGRREGNKLYIDHLVSNGTLSTLEKFAQLLIDTSDKLCNEVHREWGTTLLKEVKEKNGGVAERLEQLQISRTPVQFMSLKSKTNFKNVFLYLASAPMKNLQIMLTNEYIRIKDKFRDACKEGPPSLEDLKTCCCDQIEAAFNDRPKYTKAEDDVELCKDLEKLLRILFFRLNKWISFEFLERVLDYFKLTLESVAEEIEDYKV